jgi:hypothetical protein
MHLLQVSLDVVCAGEWAQTADVVRHGQVLRFGGLLLYEP